MTGRRIARTTVTEPPVPSEPPVNPTPPPPTDPDGPEGGEGADDPDKEKDTPSEPDEAALRDTLRLFHAALKKGSESKHRKTKAKEPDTFDGSDPRKLNSFLLQCALYFRGNEDYREDEDKVTFALSYLRGSALDHFEPDILFLEDLPDWLYDFSKFVDELWSKFGPLNPQNEACEDIDDLHMHENQKITGTTWHSIDLPNRRNGTSPHSGIDIIPDLRTRSKTSC